MSELIFVQNVLDKTPHQRVGFGILNIDCYDRNMAIFFSFRKCLELLIKSIQQSIFKNRFWIHQLIFSENISASLKEIRKSGNLYKTQ